MFLGHYAVGLAAKKVAPKVSLGNLFLAAVGLDLLWSIFLFLGWENVKLTPGITKVIPIEFSAYALSHSLVMAAAWAVLFGIVALIITRDEMNSMVLAGLVISNWFLNVLVHRPELYLLPGAEPMGMKWGLGLWNSLPLTIAVEVVLFAAGIWVYFNATKAKDAVGELGFWVFGGLMVVAFIGVILMPLPKNADWISMGSLVPFLFVAGAYWLDDHRKAV